MFRAVSRLIVIISVTWGAVLRGVEDQSAERLFNAGFTAKPQDTIQKLRWLHEHHPDDWRIRYYLATVLVENEGPGRDFQDADKLLDGAERVKEPRWIAPWALLRKYEIKMIGIRFSLGFRSLRALYRRGAR